MYPAEILEYIEILFEKRKAAQVVELVTIDGVSWQPKNNECHNNVDYYCRHHKEYEPVRGWLLFSNTHVLNCFSFLSHSVIRCPGGELVDITPSIASQQYPFIFINETDEEYFSKKNFLENGNLFYHYK